jgi:hypothetical protein
MFVKDGLTDGTQSTTRSRVTASGYPERRVQYRRVHGEVFPGLPTMRRFHHDHDRFDTDVSSEAGRGWSRSIGRVGGDRE